MTVWYPFLPQKRVEFHVYSVSTQIHPQSFLTLSESRIPSLLCFHSNPSPINPYLIREKNSRFTLFLLRSIPNLTLSESRILFTTQIHPQSFHTLSDSRIPSLFIFIPNHSLPYQRAEFRFHSDPSPIIPYLIRQQNFKCIPFPLRSIPNYPLPYQKTEFQIYSVSTKIHSNHSLPDQRAEFQVFPLKSIPNHSLPHQTAEFHVYSVSTKSSPNHSLPHQRAEFQVFSLKSIPNHSLPHQTAEFHVYSVSTKSIPNHSLPHQRAEFQVYYFHSNPSPTIPYLIRAEFQVYSVSIQIHHPTIPYLIR